MPHAGSNPTFGYLSVPADEKMSQYCVWKEHVQACSPGLSTVVLIT